MEWTNLEKCPVCGGRYKYFDRTLFEGRTLIYDYCLDCSLVFMNPVPDQEWYNSYYAEKFWEGRGDSSDPLKNCTKILKQVRWGRKLSLFLKNNLPDRVSINKILEVGCGYGLIVKTLGDKFDAKPCGVEPSESVSNFAEVHSEVSIIANNMDGLAQLDMEGFDLIVNSHVLENIVDLKKAMLTYKKMLCDGGNLLIDTPNLFIQRSLGIVHPYVFCEKSISFLLLKHGFEVTKIKKSGWGKSFFLSRHITVLARNKLTKNGNEYCDGDSFFRLKNVIGQLVVKLFSLWPFRNVDKWLVSKNHVLDSYGVTLSKSIIQKIDKMENDV